jgi:hypothetical protein
MSEQRIDTGAEAATSTDADPGEGLGTADPGAHADSLDPLAQRASGGDAEMPQPRPDEPAGSPDTDAAPTEGARSLQQAQQTAETQQRTGTDLGGREPAAARPSPASGMAEPPGSGRPAEPRAGTGEVSAPPSPERRAEDPGSVEAEFADRADTAPEDDIAHPSI